jgi:hypothetical protein
MTDAEDAGRCPTCHREFADWHASDSRITTPNGAKARQRSDAEDRMAVYRDWRWRRGIGAMTDVDAIEWSGEYPAAVFEVSRVDDPREPTAGYFQAVLHRMCERDTQAARTCHVAARLGVHAWVVLFRGDLTKFWVYDLTARSGKWWQLSPARYEEWLRRLSRWRAPGGGER